MNSLSPPTVGRWAATGASSVTSRPPAEGSTGEESWVERLYAALPLFIVGAACIVVALELYGAGTVTSLGGSGSVHLRPWILFVALGGTGICGGTAALFLSDALAEPPEVVEPVAPPHPAPAWDESLLELEPRVYGRRRTWETDDEPFVSGTSKPSPPDGVLDQIDEIAASLRRKVGPPPRE